MIYSRDGLHLTQHFECCKLAAYQDQGGVWTIGWGHTRNVLPGMTCTQEQADTWLQADVLVAASWVDRLVHAPLTQGEFDALVDFVFNCGSVNFRSSALLRKLNAGDYQGAAAELDRWDHVAGKVCAGLLKRREAEREEFVSGMSEV